MQLSIVIVNYNVKYFLEQCLCSVRKAIEKIDAEIIVIDNASSDDSINYLQPLFPETQFIQNKKNIGFGKASNQGFYLAKGEFVLFLNPDTIVSENCFEECISFFKQHKDCGALGVRMMDGGGKFLAESKRSFPSPVTSFFKLIGLAALFPNSGFFNKYASGNLRENELHEIEVLAGAFIMTTKKLLTQLNGFDESFFMYGEDIDLSYRIRQLGYKNYYLGTITILHFKGESSRRAGLNYVKMFYAAMNVFVKKHYPKWQSIFFSFFIEWAILIRAALFFTEHFTKKNSFSSTSSLKKILVIGSEVQYQQVLSLLNKRPKKIQSIERIDFDKESSSTTFISSIHSLIENKMIDEMIFCEGNGVTYNNIFYILRSIKRNVRLWFHSFNSKSLVSSHAKNLPGKTIG